jgi:hypothetical protein
MLRSGPVPNLARLNAGRVLAPSISGGDCKRRARVYQIAKSPGRWRPALRWPPAVGGVVYTLTHACWCSYDEGRGTPPAAGDRWMTHGVPGESAASSADPSRERPVSMRVDLDATWARSTFTLCGVVRCCGVERRLSLSCDVHLQPAHAAAALRHPHARERPDAEHHRESHLLSSLHRFSVHLRLSVRALLPVALPSPVA